MSRRTKKKGQRREGTSQGERHKKRNAAETKRMEGMPASEMMHEAESNLTQFQSVKAIKLLEFLLIKSPTDTKAMDLLGQAYLEANRHQDAFNTLSKSCQLTPTDNAMKWMCLGQLQSGADALKSFQTGADLLSKEAQEIKSKAENYIEPKAASAAASTNVHNNPNNGMDTDNNDNRSTLPTNIDSSSASMTTDVGDDDEEAELTPEERYNEIMSEIATAYSTIAELYMTDLCDESNAESECERYLQEAGALCPTSPEANQSLCHLRTVQGRYEEAKAALKQVATLLSQNASDMTYQFKTSTAKLALELNDFELAIDLFEHLLEEDDRYVEVWYLTGLAYLNVSNSEDTTTGGSIGDGEKAKVSEHPQADIAIQYLERALQMLEIAPDDEMKGVITDVLEQAKDMQAIQ